jgi:adenosylcobinamide-phosphate synthase
MGSLAVHFLPSHLIVAYVLDLALGDPPWAPHPIRWIGELVGAVEKRLYPQDSQARFHFLAGTAFWLVIMATVTGATWLLLVVAGVVHPVLASAVAIWLGYTTLATRSLHTESRKVATALHRQDLVGARKALSHLVSRETGEMSEEDILRALLETVAENLSDGVVAPLFYLALGGPVLGMAYKAVSTMDSMVGYRNHRYRSFGTFAARADDAANWVPARLTGWLLVAAAGCWRLNWRNARRIMARDGRKHKSPNAGIPEAAAAGALEVRLGGPSTYFGEVVVKPFLGDPAQPLSLQSYKWLIRMLYTVSFLALLPACCWRWLV